MFFVTHKALEFGLYGLEPEALWWQRKRGQVKTEEVKGRLARFLKIEKFRIRALEILGQKEC